MQKRLSALLISLLIALPAHGQVYDGKGNLKTVIQNTGASQAVPVDGSNVTQPVSATSLPLPAGAAQDATLTGGNLKARLTDGVNSATLNAAPGDALANTVVTLPSLAYLLGFNGTTWDRLRVDANKNLLVYLQNSSLPVTGTVTANAGTGTFNIQSNASVNMAQYAGLAVGASNALHVQPGTGAVFAASQSGTWNLANITGTISLPTGAAQDTTLTGGSLKAQGNIASGVADAGNPIKVGGVYNLSAPTFTTGQRGDLQLTSAGLLKVDASGTTVKVDLSSTAGNPIAIKVDGSAVTQPVSAASLPLPAGAATSAKQPALGVAGTPSTDVITVQGATGMTALKVDGSGVTQPVSGTITANVGTTNGLALDATLTGGTAKTVVRGGAKGTTTVSDITSTASGANHQPIDVAIYDAIGNQITSFGGTGGTSSSFGSAFPATGTAIGASDGANMQGLQVDASKNLKVNLQTGLPAGANTIGAVTQASGPWTNNVTQFGSSNVVTGTGLSGAGIPRVTVSNDSQISDVTATGTVTTQNLNPNSGTATAGSTVAILQLNSNGTVSIQVTGTYTGALTPQVSTDGSNWIALGSGTLISQSGALSNTIASAATGVWQANVAGFKMFRISANAAVTGTATVSLQASSASITPRLSTFQIADGNNSISITSANGDAVSNSNSQLPVISRGSGFNGTSWDRLRSGLTTVQTVSTGLQNLIPMAVYNTTPPAPANGNMTPLQSDSAGNLMVTSSALAQDATLTNGNQKVQGNVASAATDAGNPVKIGGVFNTTQPTVTTGQRVDAQATARGALIVAAGVDNFPTQSTLQATENHVGEVGGHTRYVSGSLTRPANTTAYAAGQEVSNSTTAPTILALSGMSRINNIGGSIVSATLIDEANQTTKGEFELWVFDTTSTPNNDGSAFAPAAAVTETLIGIIPFPSGGSKVGNSAAGASGNVAYIGTITNPLPFQTGAASTTLYCRLVVRNAYTPVSAEKFFLRLGVEQN